jgi:group I intron endonuclease
MRICGIYKITNPKGKVYIGQSIDIYGRWRHYELGHGKNQVLLINSIKKYGFAKHKFEIIAQCARDELNNMEKYYIDLFQCFNSQYGLNLKDGGGQQGGFSEETRERMSKGHIGIKPSLETRLKRSASVKKYMKEHPHSHSEEWKKNMSDRMKGEGNHFYNKTHSEESRQKISKSRILYYEKRSRVSGMQSNSDIPEISVS